MLTVLRVTGELAEVGAMVDAINTVSPQTMTPRARKDGYAATVSDSDDWTTMSERSRRLSKRIENT